MVRLKNQAVEKGENKMTTRAFVKAIIRILELNNVADEVIHQIRELIE